jgi:hypothetical protein
MAYATTNPPSKIASTVGGNGLWYYTSTNDVSGTSSGDVGEAGFFTNAEALGMRVGDIVFAVDTNASPIECQTFVVTAISAAGAATVVIQA